MLFMHSLGTRSLIKSQQRFSPEHLDKRWNRANRNCIRFKNKSIVFCTYGRAIPQNSKCQEVTLGRDRLRNNLVEKAYFTVFMKDNLTCLICLQWSFTLNKYCFSFSSRLGKTLYRISLFCCLCFNALYLIGMSLCLGISCH